MTAKDIIKKYEGLRLVAYPDPGSRDGTPWTIGWGHTYNVKPGDRCTEGQAEMWLDADISDATAIVDKFVRVPISLQQKDALISFVLNVGAGRRRAADGFGELKSGQPSTMLRKLNAGDYTGAAAQFSAWIYNDGHILPGLVKRRGEERALFLAGTNINPEPFPQETEMPSLDLSILTSAIPSLIGAIPEIASIFKNKNVAERNVEAISRVGEILLKSTGATNMQEAVERVTADPQTAKDANEALRVNRADIGDLMERMAKLDEDSVAAARVFSMQDKPVFGQWQFVHLISMLFVLLGGGAAIFILITSNDPSERVMALQTLLIVGFAGAASFWLGSSRSSQIKDLTRNK